MENKNTNFDILELLNKEKNNDSVFLLSNIETNKIIENCDDNLNFNILNNLNVVKEDKIEVDILNNSILNNTQNDDIITETVNENKKLGILEKILNNIIFLFKYLAISTIIFIFLLSITNYSAYIEIARSYLNPKILEQSKLNLLSSINGININQGYNSGSYIIEKKETIGEKVSMVKNKTYHSMNKLINGGYDDKLNMQIDIVPYENRIIIPKIGKNIPLIDIKNKTVQDVKELEDVFMNELSNGVVRYPGSAKPGDIGNSFIFGHSSNFPWVKGDYNDVFALIDNIVFGDEIIVYYNQKKYVYKIKDKKIIKPGDISILKRNTGKIEISLMTCWPIGTTLNRMIVIGELIQ